MQKILYGLLALVVSFGLWLYVITVENPDSETTFYNIPVVLDNESVLTDRGLMVLSDKNPTVTLKLSGNRSYLNKLNSSNITLVADLSRIYDSGEQAISYTISFPGDIPQNSIDILSQLPAQIGLSVVERDSKEIPVNVVTTGKVADGFMPIMEKMTLEHNVIRVAGPASLINEIAEARITVDIEGKKEHIDQSFRYTFYDKAGNAITDSSLTTNVSEIELSLLIQQYKEIPVVLGTITPGGGATLENTTVKADLETIVVAGSEQLLSGLEFVALEDIDLGTIREDGVMTIPLADKLPDGVTIMSGVEQVNIIIDLPELAIKKIQVHQVLPQNVPEGMNVKIVKKALSVEFRGSTLEISNLTSDQIVALVDFSNAELGGGTYAVTFQIEGYTTVEPMTGTYTVWAELTVAPPIEEIE